MNKKIIALVVAILMLGACTPKVNISINATPTSTTTTPTTSVTTSTAPNNTTTTPVPTTQPSASTIPPTTQLPVPPISVPPTTQPSANPAGPGGLQALKLKTGFYPGEGDGPQEVQKFKALEAWLGRSIPYVVLMNGYGTETDFRNGIWGGFIQPNSFKDLVPKPTVISSVPLAFGPYSPSAQVGSALLQEVIDGKHDDAYRYLGNALINAGYPNAILRLGWELDGDWMPWSAHNDPAKFKLAFRHVHDLMASMSPAFKYDWCGSATWDGKLIKWEDAWPGDSYVDVVGMDTYETPGYPFNAIQPALEAQRQFALKHGKQISYPEWALDTRMGDDTAWLNGMLGWMQSLPISGPSSIAYMGWFNGNPGGPNGEHSIPDHFLLGSQIFKQQLG